MPYCALSYVGGGVSQINLTENNREMLEKEQIFYSGQIKLPKTIRHAIELCRAISQRYLWIDCLCILDDGKETKYNQIRGMDRIYSQAFLPSLLLVGVTLILHCLLFKFLALIPMCSTSRPLVVSSLSRH
jgi:hypothetical protein